MIVVLLSFLTAFLIAYLGIPPIVRVASIRNIFDTPDERKTHKKAVPALGGVAMFAAVFFSVFFWSANIDFNHLRWIILATFVVFLQGLKDDIVAVAPVKKIVAQVIVASILVFAGNIRLMTLQDFLGIRELNEWAGIMLSYVTIIGIINAFNLIDGVDGLAGSLGLLASVVFGTLFCLTGNFHLGIVSFSMAGAFLGFLRYNFSPASIFMGDGGSLVMGLLLSILTIKLINMRLPVGYGVSSPLLALSIMIVPVTDTLRVCTLRMARGYSPFTADRNHIHHLLNDMGLNHKRITTLLVAVNVFFIAFACLLQELHPTVSVGIVVITAFAGCKTFEYAHRTHRKKGFAANANQVAFGEGKKSATP